VRERQAKIEVIEEYKNPPISPFYKGGQKRDLTLQHKNEFFNSSNYLNYFVRVSDKVVPYYHDGASMPGERLQLPGLNLSLPY
jgi:hypothetical protein